MLKNHFITEKNHAPKEAQVTSGRVASLPAKRVTQKAGHPGQLVLAASPRSENVRIVATDREDFQNPFHARVVKVKDLLVSAPVMTEEKEAHPLNGQADFQNHIRAEIQRNLLVNAALMISLKEVHPLSAPGDFQNHFQVAKAKDPLVSVGADDDRGEGAPFKRAGGFSKPFSREGGEGKRPFGKRTSDDRREGGAPFKRSGSFSKPFSREGGEEKKPFRKKFDTDKPEGTSRFAKKSFVKRDSSSEERPFKKREEGSFKPREERGTGYTKRPYAQKSSSKSTRALREDKPKSDSDLIRLNKFLANSGAGSRRDADELIRMGLVTVNGETITEMGHKVKITDDVRYEGKKMKAEKPVYILLNKPKGFITTTDDPQDRNTVMGLVAGACKERIYPVGRLDRNTTGLLLLTNDGDLADKLTHPSFNVKKIYKVELDKALTRADFEKIQQGVRLEEGRAIVDDLAYVGDDKKTIGIELHIGWNRIVRRIFESLGYEVIKLDRSVYAGLDKKDLSRGQWRFLKPEEVIQLKHFGK
jgi:23S rRNA pseudouridine2605 synthase